MPSAASVKPEKAPPAEASGVPPSATSAAENSPIRQVLVIIEHKIRNLEKRKSKLTSYRDLQKSGKELNADQKVAVAKYDEVVQTLEFARDMCKQVTSVAISAEREAKKQAKKDAWVRTMEETAKIRDVLLVLDCLMQLGSGPARDDFLNGTNGAAKLEEADLKILDDLYSEVTPRHEPNAEGAAAFPALATRAAEHLAAIADARHKEVLGTTYAHIKRIVAAVHECGYFDKIEKPEEPIPEETVEETVEEEPPAPIPIPVPVSAPPAPAHEVLAPPMVYPPPPHALPSPAPLASAAPPAPYPIHPLPPITLQEVENAYFQQQYAQQQPRPITEVIGNQNFFFLQESEIDSPAATPQPAQPSPPGPIPTQTFTNQSYMMAPRVPDVLPPPHFTAPPVDMTAFPPPHLERMLPQPQPPPIEEPAEPAQAPEPEGPEPEQINDDEANESPDRDRERTIDGEAPRRGGRKFGRGARRGQSNGVRGRGFQGRQGDYQSDDGYQPRENRDGYQQRESRDGYQPRENRDGYQGRQNRDGYQPRENRDGYQPRDNRDGYQPRENRDGYQPRENRDGYQPRENRDGYQPRENRDGYQPRENRDGYQPRENRDGYQPRHNREGYQPRQSGDYQGRNGGYQGRRDDYARNGNGESGGQENGTQRVERDGGFQGGFKGRGRGGGGPRGGFRAGPPRSARPPPQYTGKRSSGDE